jgi:hypothetical protein
MLPREGKGTLPGASIERYQNPLWRAMEGAGLAWGARTPRGPRVRAPLSGQRGASAAVFTKKARRGATLREFSVPGAGFASGPAAREQCSPGPGVQFAPGRFAPDAPPLPTFKSNLRRPQMAAACYSTDLSSATLTLGCSSNAPEFPCSGPNTTAGPICPDPQVQNAARLGQDGERASDGNPGEGEGGERENWQGASGEHLPGSES